MGVPPEQILIGGWTIQLKSALGPLEYLYPPLCQKSRRAVGSTPFEASSPFVERRLDLGDRLIEHRPNVEFAIILSG